MKTFMANAQTVERKWYVVDADGMTLGRLASQVAAILRGKNKPTYTPPVSYTHLTLPKGPLGRQMARKLRVYAGAEHEHEAHKPEVLELVK